MDLLLDLLRSGVPALIGAFAGAYLTRGQTQWTRAGTARDKARDQLAEIVSWRWNRNPDDKEDLLGAQRYDERLRSYLRAAGVPQKLINRLRDELASFRGYIEMGAGDGDEALPYIPSQFSTSLDEVVEEIHTWLDDAERRRWRSSASRGRSRALMGSSGGKT